MVDQDSRERGERAEREGGPENDLHDEDRHSAGGAFLNEGGYDEEHGRRDPGNPLWDEGLIALLIVGGLVLLVFPEPTTSAVGALVLAAGVLAWLVDAIG